MTPFKLSTRVVVQPEVTADSAVVLQITDTPGKSVKALVELGGNPSAHYWVDVCPEKYNPAWTDDDVQAATRLHFEELAKG